MHETAMPLGFMSSSLLAGLGSLSGGILHYLHSSPGSSVVRNMPANAGDMCSIPGSGRSPARGNGNPLRILAWRIPWTQEPGGLQPMGMQSATTY